MLGQRRWMQIGIGIVAVSCAGTALADLPMSLSSTGKPYALITGRRDPRVFVVDINAAIRPENQDTPNAIVSRAKNAPDRIDGKVQGDSANILISSDGKRAWVVNHHGNSNPTEIAAFTHGGRGTIAAYNVGEMIKAQNNDTIASMYAQYDSGWFGPVGLAEYGDVLLISHSESDGKEDGGRNIVVMDKRTGGTMGKIEFALGNPGFACPTNPIPQASPHPDWGCFPDTNGIGIAHTADGKAWLFAAHGGTDEVGVVDLHRALTGDPNHELRRIKVQTGPFGLAVSPNQKYVVTANRESQQVAFEGNTISIIDVERAVAGDPGAEVARVRVGTDNPSTFARTFTAAFTPDGNEIAVANFRTNNVSIVDLQKALAGDPGAEVARIPLVNPPHPDGVVRPSRPKGTGITRDGKYLVVSGGARTAFPLSGVAFIIDMQTRQVVGRVTGVGNDPYGLAIAQ